MAMSATGKRVTRKGFWPLLIESVPQTDSGGLVEYTKVIEKTFPKELGKKAIVTSGYGLPPKLLFGEECWRPQRKSLKRLFIKNLAPC